MLSENISYFTKIIDFSRQIKFIMYQVANPWPFTFMTCDQKIKYVTKNLFAIVTILRLN